MLPPLLCLVLLFGLLLCFPRGVFPLPVLTLKGRLYLREQDAGKGLYLVIGNPRAVVIGFLSARHGITPLKLPLVEQIALKYRSVPSDEAATRVLGNLFGGAGVVENDLALPHTRKFILLRIWPGLTVAFGLCVARIRWIPNARPCRAMVGSRFSICESSFFRSLSAPADIMAHKQKCVSC